MKTIFLCIFSLLAISSCHNFQKQNNNETAFRPVPGHQCDTGSKTDYPSVSRFPDSVFCHFLLRPCFPCPIYTPCLSVPIVLCHPRSHSASSAAGAGSRDGTTVGSPPTVPLPAPDSSCHPPAPRLHGRGHRRRLHRHCGHQHGRAGQGRQPACGGQRL